MFERLYDISEQAQINYVGYVSERARYDFAIVYTDHFFGKPLVICMQTNQSSILSEHDLYNLEHLQQVFHLSTVQDAEELALFLQQRIPSMPSGEQY